MSATNTILSTPTPVNTVSVNFYFYIFANVNDLSLCLLQEKFKRWLGHFSSSFEKYRVNEDVGKSLNFAYKMTWASLAENAVSVKYFSPAIWSFNFWQKIE